MLRFGELRVGKIAALISHDFSTVQMADRIVVFDGGQLSEVGCAGYVSHPASFPAWITQVASTGEVVRGMHTPIGPRATGRAEHRSIDKEHAAHVLRS